jgi:hypothetical protein
VMTATFPVRSNGVFFILFTPWLEILIRHSGARARDKIVFNFALSE